MPLRLRQEIQEVPRGVEAFVGGATGALTRRPRSAWLFEAQTQLNPSHRGARKFAYAPLEVAHALCEGHSRPQPQRGARMKAATRRTSLELQGLASGDGEIGGREWRLVLRRRHLLEQHRRLSAGNLARWSPQGETSSGMKTPPSLCLAKTLRSSFILYP